MSLLHFLRDFAFLLVGLVIILVLTIWAEMRDDGRPRDADNPFEEVRPRQPPSARPGNGSSPARTTGTGQTTTASGSGSPPPSDPRLKSPGPR